MKNGALGGSRTQAFRCNLTLSSCILSDNISGSQFANFDMRPVESTKDAVRLHTNRERFSLCLLITFFLGVGSFFMRGTVVDDFANHAGGSLYVLAWIFFILMLAPRFAPLQVCVVVLLGTCAIEVLQLWHLPILEAARGTLPGRILLGTTFVWSDFPAYGAGALVGLAVATKISSGATPSLPKNM